MLRLFNTAILSCALVLLSACASTATGISASAIKKTAAPRTYTGQAPAGATLAVVRYPAFVTQDAQDTYYDAFGNQVIGGQTSAYDAGSPEVRGLADGVILKSNYFALSLYKELAAKLPPHSVLLSPHVIKKAADDTLISEPMTEAESLANVLTIDFVSYTFPDTSKMMGKEPLSFGDLITPLVTVKTDYRAAVPTQGLLLGSRPLIPLAAASGRGEALDALDTLQTGRLISAPSDLDFVTFLNGSKAFSVAQKPLDQKRGENAVRGYNVEKIKLDSVAILSMNDGDEGTIDPLENSFSKPLANQIVGILNRTDTYKAVMAGRAASIAQFDESLAALTFVGTEDQSYKTRLRYAERLLDAQKNYLSVQSLRLFDGIHNGEMGAQVRDMIKAEYDILEQRRDLARKQNAAVALAVLGAVAATGAIANDNGNSYGEQVAINALIQGAVFAGTQAYAIGQRSKAVGSNYLSSIAPALEEQASIQVNLIDSNETITAIRFEDLKEKLQALYTNNQRSLQTIATRCGYTHTGSEKVGTWLGECTSGLGSGSGVGVLTQDGGTSIEYYGLVENGQPHGPGFMIYHTPSESYSLEGLFSMGLPNGTIRLSKAGQLDQLRQYDAGRDLGPAPLGAVISSPFESPSPSQAIN